MGKIKDLFRGEQGTFYKFVNLCVTLFVVLWLVGPGNTVIYWAKSRSELRHQKKQMEVYRNEIEEMKRKVQMLESDKDSLEKFAREQFYFSVPGEDVFVVGK